MSSSPSDTPTHTASKTRAIKITGARTNTLHNVSCSIPHRRLTVITGPSGSGKSSLAFDTLYAEGQRRYMSSLSSYARQFMERLEKPDVEDIENILPAIALSQKNHVKNARSTVGTATELDDSLRVMFATIGQMHCDACGGEVSENHPQQMETLLASLPEGSKLLLCAPISLDKQSIEAILPTLLSQGYFRVVQMLQPGSPPEILEFSEETPPPVESGSIDILVDRLVLKQPGKEKTNPRLSEAIRNALQLGMGMMAVYHDGIRQVFHGAFACNGCGKAFQKPQSAWFSFNSPLGACPTCEGFGRIIGLDWDKVIPNKQLSLAEGAVHPFTMPSNQEIFDDLMSEARKAKVRTGIPYHELDDREKTWVMNGKGEYPGVRRFFDWLESKKYKVHVRVMLARYRSYTPCPDCLGSRLAPSAKQVRLFNKTLWELQQLPVETLKNLLETASKTLSDKQLLLAGSLLQTCQGRLAYLVEIGLGYLTLARQTRTLSGGESQRIHLSTALGSLLTDTLYVLDEPTVGLHARDTHRLLGILRNLRDHGNTVVVVEHDADVIRQADTLLDMGPGGGKEGGRIVYDGSPEGLLSISYSLTAQYLNTPPQADALSAHKDPKPKGTGKTFGVLGASGNNLKNVSVNFPSNRLVCVTGVSGSGKSTLIKQTLYAGYQHNKGQELMLDAAPCQSLVGLEAFEDVLLVDQSPPGRSLRSNPATYLKAYDDIRKAFADSRKAMTLGLSAGDFSFNTPGGRCETCEGMGTLTIDMQFMADVTVVCQDCQGRRFNQNVLSVELEGKTITDVLAMTVDEAMAFFAGNTRLQKKLLPFSEMGLGYLCLGQSTATLSGGEAQRLKLASYLAEGVGGKSSGKSSSKKPYLFLFDEPTTGLHLSDIDRLVGVFRKLLSYGHSLVIIEHNLDFIAQADYVVDLGPEGGDAGGQIIATGTLADMISCTESQTGYYLKGRVAAPQPVVKSAAKSTVKGIAR